MIQYTLEEMKQRGTRNSSGRVSNFGVALFEVGYVAR